MRAIALALAAFATSALAGCTTWSVKSDYNKTADFGQYRTYAWLAPPTGSPEAGFAQSLVDQRVKAETQADLAAKGIRPIAQGEKPDFVIAYRVAAEPKIEVTDWGYAYDPWYWGPAGPSNVTSYTEGTLVLDFIDTASRRVFWRGVASRPIEDPAASSERVGEAVDRILEKYPPQGYASAPRPAG